MSVRSRNWLKFGGLLGLSFALGLLFAGLLDLPQSSAAQGTSRLPVLPARAEAQTRLSGTSGLVDLSESFAAIVEHVRPSVVYVVAQRTERATTRRIVPPGFEQFFGRTPNEPRVERGSGTGFIVSNDGYILTNNHVVENADQVRVRLLDRREFEAKVVGTDPTTDVAVLKIDAAGLTPATLGRSQEARVGEWVLAIGNPLGENLTFTVTSGIVSAKGRGALQLGDRSNGLGIQDFIQTDAAINPGNSGGPLVNVRGEVIGINSAIASQTGYNVGYGFAIPIDLANQVMAQLIQTGHVQRSVLGVSVQEVTPDIAEYAGLDKVQGVVVQDFGDNSPAKRAGVRKGDVIIEVDGQPVQYVAQLQQMVGFRKPGEQVSVQVARRGGTRKTYQVRLMAQATDVAAATPSEDDTTPGARNRGSAVTHLGIQVEPLDADWVRRLDLPGTVRGLVVTAVEAGGTADGKLFGPSDTNAPDIIVAVDDAPVATEQALQQALQKAGKVVAITVYNQGLDQGGGGQRIVWIRLANK